MDLLEVLSVDLEQFFPWSPTPDLIFNLFKTQVHWVMMNKVQLQLLWLHHLLMSCGWQMMKDKHVLDLGK